MILHKLLFFKLPYRSVSMFEKYLLLTNFPRYASVSDANGEPISRDDEGEKMERLEKEVQEYPGYIDFAYRQPHIFHLLSPQVQISPKYGYRFRKSAASKGVSCFIGKSTP